MAIITIPHPTLRVTADPVAKVDKKILQVIQELEHTLTHNDKGVGLAAVQIDQPVRIFSTYLSDQGDREENRRFRTFINPEITATYGETNLGDDEESTPLEGCLSIPDFYGPVPRFYKIKVAFQTWENGQLLDQEEEFEDFYARVVQHELDHLNGVLFIDYSLEFDLPIYKENKKSGKLEEISSTERKIFEVV